MVSIAQPGASVATESMVTRARIEARIAGQRNGWRAKRERLSGPGAFERGASPPHRAGESLANVASTSALSVSGVVPRVSADGSATPIFLAR